MQLRQRLFVISIALGVAGAAAVDTACSSSGSPATNGDLPSGAVSFTGPVPAGVPTSCFSNEYTFVSGDGPCGVQGYYLLYVGDAWADSVCAKPGEPWETSESGGSGDAGSSDGSSNGDGGSGDGGGVVTGSWNGTVQPASNATKDSTPCDAVNDCCLEDSSNPYCQGTTFTNAPSGEPICAEIYQLSLDYGYCGGVTYSGYQPVDYTQPSEPGELDEDAGSGDASAPDATASGDGGSDAGHD